MRERGKQPSSSNLDELVRRDNAGARHPVGAVGVPLLSATDSAKLVAVVTLIGAMIALALLGTILFVRMP